MVQKKEIKTKSKSKEFFSASWQRSTEENKKIYSRATRPLIAAMSDYLEDNVYPLHTPGHKGGRGMDEPLKTLLGETVCKLDVSLMHELDDIHAPEACIRDAQDKTAAIYGSDACFFAVNGTSGAVHAMLMTALKPGEKVLIPRNAHKSVSGALILAGVQPVYVEPVALGEFSLMGQVELEQVKKAFALYSDIKAVLLTSPDYFGMTADVAAIADFVHSQGAVLLIDEAHGVHLGFTDRLPESALEQGADMVAQSTHKILGAMTQCSWLHVKKDRIDMTRAADCMSLLTTTSPNYMLMASLDAAGAQLAEQGKKMMNNAVEAAAILREKLQKVPGIRVIEKKDVLGKAGITDMDSCKVTINITAWRQKNPAINGIKVGEYLRQKNIAVELVAPENVLFLVTYADLQPEWNEVTEKIAVALQELAEEYYFFNEETETEAAVIDEKADIRVEDIKIADEETAADEKDALAETAVKVKSKGEMLTLAAMTPLEVFNSKKEVVALKTAADCICAESISFYPPGIPLVLPGEKLTPSMIDYLSELKNAGLPVSGPADISLKTVRIVSGTEDDGRVGK